jgi:hypothetical protein
MTAILHTSYTQSTTDTASSVPSPTTAAVTSTVESLTPKASSLTQSSMATMYISTRQSSSTASNATASATGEHTNDPLGPSSSQMHPGHIDPALKYYFLIAALLGVLAIALSWWARIRQRRRKEQMGLGRQHALERDMEGWINTRRWYPGIRRHNQTAAFIRREEGLNEHGEAPPPYEPETDVTVARAARDFQEPVGRMAIPLRTLSRDEIEQGRPPRYRG